MLGRYHAQYGKCHYAECRTFQCRGSLIINSPAQWSSLQIFKPFVAAAAAAAAAAVAAAAVKARK